MAKLTTIKVNKNGNYTVMSNYHLRDKTLSLKAKGLMSYMLSLPPEWDFSVVGLASCLAESKNTISKILNELIDKGYMERRQERQGKLFSGYSYILHELSCRKSWDTKTQYPKNEAQINTKEINTKKINKEVVEDATTSADQEVFTLYQDNIHPITPLEAEKLADDIERYGNEWVIEAIKRSVLRNKRTLGYIEAILHNWETNGFDDGEKKQEEDPDGFRQPLITEDPQYIEMQRIREELRQIGVDA